ncbi:MAG TPA: hypothetical protein VFF06_33920 [Polyangia bacterium]|nr:hypothetical protein [Polyangia bacterium]
MIERIREAVLAVVALALAVALVSAGATTRAAAAAAVGAAGVALTVWLGGRERRWPRLTRHARAASRVSDERLWPLLDSAEDALRAIALDGREFRRALAPIERDAIGLAQRALALGRIRAGHEATLARIALEPEPTALELESRTEVKRLDAELESLRRALVTIGPSVRHLRLLAATGEAGAAGGDSPSEIESRLATLRHALAEEMAS